ncbi:mitochondrial ribosome assembly protein RRG9 [Aspergillus undulatus]|uniref:mitochondrial ribosome assembly protein RRG9 n=1 Tax=Aspergillus undulatus TaxID=1810928 RepID=UPI003CCE1268
MPFNCTKSARISLPNVLQSIFSSELAPQLRIPSTRPLSRPFLPRQSARSRMAITTVSIDSIPITSAQKPQTPAPSQDGTSTATDNSKLENQTSDDQASAQVTKSAASSPSTSDSNSKSKKHNKKTASDRDAKKATSKDRKNDGLKPPKRREAWEVQKDALKKKFPAGWTPPKKLSPDAMEGIRHLHSVQPNKFTTAVLAQEFKVSPEAIRRILKSKWRPSEAEMEKRRQRWDRRHERIWGHLAELGLRPKRRGSSVGDPAEILNDRKSKTSGDSPSV